MSQDIFKGEWLQLKGQVKQWWGDLTDDDVHKIDGSFDKLVGAVQARYGHSKERALDEVKRRVDDFRRSGGSSGENKPRASSR